MSTRATYQFHPTQRHELSPTIYVHHDGYQTGAAAYFYAMLLHPNHKGGLSCMFIRANDGAELTTSHQDHGDTKYRYDISGDGPEATLKVAKRRYDDGYGVVAEKWPTIYTGPLHEFIAAYPSLIDEFKPFKIVKINYGVMVWLNETTAKARLEHKYGPLQRLRVWHQMNSCKPGSANWDTQIAELQEMMKVFPELRTCEIDEFLNMTPAEV
jgi:hypothetical protein